MKIKESRLREIIREVIKEASSSGQAIGGIRKLTKGPSDTTTTAKNLASKTKTSLAQIKKAEPQATKGGTYPVFDAKALGSARYVSTDGRKSVYSSTTDAKTPRGFSRWEKHKGWIEWDVKRQKFLDLYNQQQGVLCRSAAYQ